ncbi:MAG: M48 family metallopeptidase [Candidatus Magasanikbacteria bacterium]
MENCVIPYKIKRSARIKRIRIVVDNGEYVTIKASLNANLSGIEKFLEKEKEWISLQLQKFKREKISLTSGNETYHGYRLRAHQLVRDRLRVWNVQYGYTYNTIRIKDTGTRWGSCSSQKNLNFNYRIYFLPEHLQDYIIVHELCHLEEMNHSFHFWNLVKKTVPDYRKRKHELKKYSL